MATQRRRRRRSAIKSPLRPSRVLCALLLAKFLENTPMWESRCKVAVSGVGFSKVSRTADVPLAVHALIAVKEAVADSGLELSDIDGLATYPELPATGHAEVDGISVVSVNCMMAMLKLPNLAWHIQVGTVNIGGAVQQAVNALLAGVCNYALVWRHAAEPHGPHPKFPTGIEAR